MTLYEDMVDADTDPKMVSKIEKEINAAEVILTKMAKSGGFVMRLEALDGNTAQ